MFYTYKKIKRFIILFLIAIVLQKSSVAQTDMDAIMMEKRQFCVGPMFGYSSWKNYWEGTTKRDNANLGRVSSKTYSIMGNFGVSNKLNVLFNVPYVQTKASAGQLHGMKGFQDLSLWVKYMPVEKETGPGIFSLYTLGGLSFPLSSYTADYLPLSIGLKSTNLSFRLMADYQLGSWFTTLSGTYIHRSNVSIDRTAYYSTEMHYTNEVDMPDAMQYNFRTGLRNEKIIAEVVLSNWTTLGGFDITKNNMPFVSNKMNSTAGGLNFKYNFNKPTGLSLTGGAQYVFAGRNVGQSQAYNLGIFYILDFNKKKRSQEKEKNNDKEAEIQ
jgi:hypothetical protein